MELSIAGIIAAVGIIFGLNFIGLFVATYVFDRKAVHVLYYLGAAACFMGNGACYILSIVTPYTAFFLVALEIFQAGGFIALSAGLARAFSIKFSGRLIWTLFVIGSISTFSLSGLSQLDVGRLMVVGLWHITVVYHIVSRLIGAPDAGFKHWFLGALVSGTAIAAANRPITAAMVQLIYPDMSFAEQANLYGTIVNLVYLTALFGVGAGVFFHVMSDLASGYRNASITDSLTGLFNRRGFIDAAEKIDMRPASLIMLDIDDFKTINDNYGHDAGDRVLAKIAQVIADAATEPHICGRLGGEEFAIALRHTEVKTAQALAQSLRTAITVELDGYIDAGHSVTASFGLAPIIDGGLAQALVVADHALYEAKRAGKDRVRVGNVARRKAGRARPATNARAVRQTA